MRKKRRRDALGESPAYLMAAAYSAHRSGDRELERVARQRLHDEYGIELVFRHHCEHVTAITELSEVQHDA